MLRRSFLTALAVACFAIPGISWSAAAGGDDHHGPEEGSVSVASDGFGCC